ncbi:hypothetical protein [Bartonella sp. B39]
MFIKEHPITVTDRDEKSNIIYLKDENGNPIKDSRGQNISKFHCLNAEENQHLQEGSDGKVHASFNGTSTSSEEATVYAEQHAKDKIIRFILLWFPKLILPYQSL